MNQITLIGNLGGDPVPFGNPTQGVKLSVATTERYNTKEGDKKTDTTWHTVWFNGKISESIAKYCKKGHRVAISGTLKSKEEEYQGVKRTVWSIRGEKFEFLERAENSNETETASGQSNTTSKVASQTPAYQQSSTVAATQNTSKKQPLAATVTHTDEDLTMPELNDDLPF